ncbi:hypothetical protein GQ55_9G123500 [Panicum hallii var. hallii]|uniref:Uncharacterized protein n=1 Tax=Panicum hallii var. hallii TaxID=1504633 RepID=A0A2T7C2C0_9POAL|nr:hypothetical protein GQ55_9G123500 [Panicum hallii var. hallii]
MASPVQPEEASPHHAVACRGRRSGRRFLRALPRREAESPGGRSRSHQAGLPAARGALPGARGACLPTATGVPPSPHGRGRAGLAPRLDRAAPCHHHASVLPPPGHGTGRRRTNPPTLAAKAPAPAPHGQPRGFASAPCRRAPAPRGSRSRSGRGTKRTRTSAAEISRSVERDAHSGGGPVVPVLRELTWVAGFVSQRWRRGGGGGRLARGACGGDG